MMTKQELREAINIAATIVAMAGHGYDVNAKTAQMAKALLELNRRLNGKDNHHVEEV